MQHTTLNVKGAACDLFYVSMGINHGKLPLKILVILNAVSLGKRVIYQGKEFHVTEP